MNTMKMTAAGTLLGGSLLVAGGLGLAHAAPPEAQSVIGDGKLNVTLSVDGQRLGVIQDVALASAQSLATAVCPVDDLSPRLADLDTNLVPSLPACNSVTGGLSYTFTQNGGAAEVAPAQSPTAMIADAERRRHADHHVGRSQPVIVSRTNALPAPIRVRAVFALPDTSPASRPNFGLAARWPITSSVGDRAGSCERFVRMGRLFGTDGVRGVANRELTAELALALGAAAARRLAATTRAARPVAVIGRDPRASGEMLEAAVIAGVTSEGVDALRVGVLPTPAVAYLTGAYGADFGVMISASHNPMPDNGIKIFGPGGHKLDDATEDRIEELVAQGPGLRPVGAEIGRIVDATDALERYLQHVRAAAPVRLDGLTVVVDCANGAASAAAPRAYHAAGARVIAINAEPNGLNINAGCGSTHLEQVQAAVIAHGADLGLAHDGDADRCLAVDASGQVVDGDAIMVVLAMAMQESGELASNTLVATVMSNLGLHLAMRQAGIAVRTTGVGDRYVLEELRAGEYSLGGEQSGHIVMPSMATTGDGIVTGLRLMSRMAQTRTSLAGLAAPMQTMPQVLINVEVTDKATVAEAPGVQSAVREAEAELGDTGRILLRPSGTEQLVRVMVEAADEDTARQVAIRVAESVSAEG